MRILLDSHTLIWWFDKPTKIRPEAQAALSDPANTLYASSVSIWELGLKAAKKKLVLPKNFIASLPHNGYQMLDFTMAHALASTSLPPIHRDPFDRALIAQCLQESLTLATRDPQILKYRLNTLAV